MSLISRLLPRASSQFILSRGLSGFRHTPIDMDDARKKIAQQIKVDVLTPTQEEDNKRALKDISRSFLSDTITVPTPEMFAYASRASLGDDVYSEPCTHALEIHMAKITGKEAALFVPSGTMSNQVALRTHLQQPPHSVLCDYRSHVVRYEAGGIAFHSGAHAQMVVPSNGHHLTLEDVQENVVLGKEIHSCPTTVISLENTLNGTIFPQDEIIRISEYAHANGLKMHLDGARIWHVAAEVAKPLDELCAPFDSVSLCLSKGLGAPIGSCLVGSKDYIDKARWFRKSFGGGMRQTGFMAASAAYALTHNFLLLPTVHELTRKLEKGLVEIGVEITSAAETCMVFFDPSPIGVSYTEIVDRASQLPEPIKVSGSRLVVHIHTAPETIEDFLGVVRQLAEEKKAAGYEPPEKKTYPNGRPYSSIYVRGVKRTTEAQ